MADLFTKPLSLISYDDIKSFCDAKIAENVRVDYKENFPDDLAKSIVGFANKYGGILFIGVKADKRTNIPTSIPGVNLVDGLEEKVISISQANINPPISPEVCVCPFKSKSTLSDDDKAIVFIRVGESSETPHMNLKDRDNKIYIRIHNETRPAELDMIKELFIKGKEAKYILNLIINEKIIQKTTGGYRTAYVIPASPIKPIINFNLETDKFLSETTPEGLRFGNLIPIRDGVIFERISDVGAEVTKEGLIYYTENWIDYDKHGIKQGDIHIDRTMFVLIKILQYSKIVFEKYGFFGKVMVGIDISDTKGKFLFAEVGRGINKKYTTIEPTITINQIFSYEEFADIVNPTVILFEILFRSFGLVTERKVLVDWVKKYVK